MPSTQSQPTALDRARRFIKSAALRTALVIAPLALTATSAQAAAIFETSGGNFYLNAESQTGFGSGSFLDFSNFAATGNVVGFKGFGNVQVIDTCGECGAQQLGFTVEFYGNAGSGSTPFDISEIPVSYIFNLAFGNSASWAQYFLDFTINGQTTSFSGGLNVPSFSRANPYSGPNPPSLTLGNNSNFNGLGVVPVTLGGNLNDWSVILRVQGSLEEGDTFVLSIPSDSIDIGVAPVSNVPEPGTALLLVPGAALILISRRRKK